MNESASHDDIVIPAGEVTMFKNLMPFVIKMMIVTIIIFGGISSLLPNFRQIITSLQNEALKEQSRIRLTGLFTTNPAVHMKASYIHEEAGDIKNGIMEIELAVGLLELHSADKAIRNRYETRLEELRKKLPPKANQATKSN